MLLGSPNDFGEFPTTHSKTGSTSPFGLNVLISHYDGGEVA